MHVREVRMFHRGNKTRNRSKTKILILKKEQMYGPRNKIPERDVEIDFFYGEHCKVNFGDSHLQKSHFCETVLEH